MTPQAAVLHLTANDPILAEVIHRVGSYPIRPHANYYQELVEGIVGQQLSVKAAASINKRFVELFDGTFPTPEQLLAKSIDDLRSAGLSRTKASYIQDLAQHVIDGRVTFDNIEQLSNDEIIKELTAVKGIGEWTVHMFLIFAMGRLDVLAHGDLGVRMGIMKLYNLDHPPTPAEVQQIAIQKNWSPYESVACWYVWQSLK